MTATSKADPSVSDSAICVAHAFEGGKPSPTDDAYVYEDQPDSNYGGEDTLYLQSSTGKNERIYLKFDLSAIPPGFTIVDAELWLWCRKAEFEDINAECWSVKDEDDVFIDEDMITWGTQPYPLEALLDTVALKYSPPSKDMWHTWDVTSFVQGEFAGDNIASFCVRAAEEDTSGRYLFNSSEWSSENTRPRLKITYEAAVPGVDVSISPKSQENIPGGTLKYTVTVRNTGTSADTYDLSASDTAGWSPGISPSSLTVAGGASEAATLNVTVPSDAEPGTEDTITVTATSQTDSEISDNDSCIAHTFSGPAVSVSISPDENSDEPGKSVIFTVTIKNMEDVADTYMLGKSDTAGWTLDLPSSSGSLAPGASVDKTLTVTIPSDAGEGDSTTVTVTATSTENSEISAFDTCTARAVIGVGGVEVTIDPTTDSGSAGEELAYLVAIKNTGDLADTYSLEATNDWGVEIAAGPYSLDSGESRSGIRLTVTIPEDAAEGDSTTITVTATSQTDSSIESSATCTGEVEAAAEFPLIPVAGAVVVVVVIIGVILVIRPF